MKSLASAELARTGELGFYDKECTAQCSTDPAGSGASTANGATTNAGTAANRPDGGNGGATLDGSNANYFEMFRDNDTRPITVDAAYPTGDWKTLDYKGQAPIATTVSMWNGNTPKTVVDPMKGGGQFIMSAVNAKDEPEWLFKGSRQPTT